MGETGDFQAVEDTKTGGKPNAQMVRKCPENINHLHHYPIIMGFGKEHYYYTINQENPQQNNPGEGQASDDKVRQRDSPALEPAAAIDQPNETIPQHSEKELGDRQSQKHPLSES